MGALSVASPGAFAVPAPRTAPVAIPGLERAPAARWPRLSRNRAVIKTREQIEGIREAGRVTARILDLLEDRIRPGITTEQINSWVHEETLAAGGIPAPLNYRGFPKSVCTSANQVVCHGIPREDEVLREGDIINVDVTTILNGCYGDASRMYLIGEVSAEAQKLVRVTRECLERGIAAVKPGGHAGDIGHAIQTHAEANGFSVVRDFVGHGTGIQFHEDPQILHYGEPHTGHPLLPGMVFTIEPMINAGDWRVRILDDGWTAITVDGSLSAQFEHTLAVTETGADILTQ
ncbi:MAG: type I methionyl aminopeptidase [Gemmatimonadetes bacterium]|nr:type I methionyl aminopeptidase [Gemmatimonadota bacterium]